MKIPRCDIDNPMVLRHGGTRLVAESSWPTTWVHRVAACAHASPREARALVTCAARHAPKTSLHGGNMAGTDTPKKQPI